MSASLRRLDLMPLLRSAPIALPQVFALLALVTLSAAEGGYPLEHWGPAAVLVELLLLVALVSLPARRERSPGSRIAIAAIVGLAFWTLLSLAWADDRGAAALATTRTALLAATFVLFARWRHTPRTAAMLLTLLVVGFGILSWGVLLKLQLAGSLDAWFLYDRLLEPVGYVNAGAAFWGVGAFLAVGLISTPRPPGARITGALVAVPAAALSLLCLSRGGLLATAIVVILLLLLLPGRARNAAALGIAALGLAVAAPGLLDVGRAVTDLTGSTDPAATLHSAILRVMSGTALAALLTLAWIALERRVAPGDRRRTQSARAGAGLLATAGLLAVVLAVAGVGPVTVDRIRDTAGTITEGYKPIAPGETRLSAGLGSGRWDFWTVAWQQFEQAPVAGKGADNYRQDYLEHGSSLENPRYPHSLWLRSLGQLGLIGTALLLAWVAGVAVAVRRLAAGHDPAGRALALAVGGAFGLWVVHGSADWLLEYGGFSAIVAAVSGLAVASAPPARTRRAPRAGRTAGRHFPPLAVPLGATLLVLTAAWTAAQWVADRDLVAAGALAVDQPQRAVQRAERAGTLDRFGEQPDSLLGALALRRGDLGAARAAYLRAYDRNPRATRPRLWLGVIASSTGDETEAGRWLRRARRTAPRDAVLAQLEAQVRAGKRLEPQAVQRILADRTAQLVRDPDPPKPD